MSRAERIAVRAEARRQRAEQRALRAAERLAESTAVHPIGQSTVAGDSTFPQESPFIDADSRPLHLSRLYLGASCFIVLSGPSIRELDLSLLRRRGIFTFSVNNSPSLFRPNAWTHVDPLSKFHESIWLDPSVLKIVNARRMHHGLRRKLPDGRFMPMMKSGLDGKLTAVACREMPGVIFDRRNASFDPADYLSQPSTCWGVNKKHANRTGRQRVLNVMLAVIKHAYALGFRVVYLIGCDFKMTTDRPYAFDESKDSGGVNGNNSSYAKLDEMFRELRPSFDAACFHVRNCNPNSGLTAFDHVPYIKAIEAATGHIPQDPLDTVGWYEKR